MKNWHKDSIAYGLLLCVGILFYAKTLFGGFYPVPTDTLVGMYHPWRDIYAKEYPRGIPYKNYLITDPVRQQIPWRMLAIDTLKKGNIPSYNPTAFAGSPLAGNIQSGAFYPLNILFFLFSFPVAWSALIISQTVGCLFFGFLFLRKLRLSRMSSVFGAVSFACMGFSIAWLTWGTMVSSFMWVPLVLSGVIVFGESVSARKKLLWAGITVCSIFSMISAGHSQIALYGIGVALLFALWQRKTQKKWNSFLWFLGSLCVGCVFAYPILQAAFGTMMQSLRATSPTLWNTEGFFIPFIHLIGFFTPDYFGNPSTLNYSGVWNYGEMVGYIGAGALLFAFFGIFSGVSETVFWVLLTALSLLFATDNPVAKLPYTMGIPIFSSLQPTRLLSVIGLSLSVLAAYGLDYAIGKNTAFRKKGFFVPLIIAIFYIALLVQAKFSIFMSQEQGAVAFRNTLLPAVIACAAIGIFFGIRWMKDKQNKHKVAMTVFLGLLLVLHVFDLTRFGWKFTPFTDPAYFFPTSKVISYLASHQDGRTVVLDDRIAPPNTLAYYGIRTVGGYDPLYPKEYAQFLSSIDSGEYRPDVSFLRIINPKNYSSSLFRYLSPTYILSFEPIAGDGFVEVMKEGSTILTKNTSSLPLVYFADSIVYAQDTAVAIQLMKQASQSAYPAVVTGDVPWDRGTEIARARILEQNMEGGNIRLQTQSDSTGVLVVGEMYAPKWSASIDGRKTDIARVNAAFMGIMVPSGAHTIHFEYGL